MVGSVDLDDVHRQSSSTATTTQLHDLHIQKLDDRSKASWVALTPNVNSDRMQDRRRTSPYLRIERILPWSPEGRFAGISFSSLRWSELTHPR